MTKEELRAYIIYKGQVSRHKKHKYGPLGYTAAEFAAWWIKNLKTRKKWSMPTTGRIDHSIGYSFDNIELVERVENIIERNERRGNPGKKHRSVTAFDIKTHRKVKSFLSKRDAAKFYGICEKTIYNHCQNRTKSFDNFGPLTGRVGVFFRWTK